MSTPKVEFLPEFADELLEAHRWYAERSLLIAERLKAEVHQAVRSATAAPQQHRRYLSGTRRVRLRTFPYKVVYRATEQLILFVAFVHDKQRPGYWHERLER